MEIQATNGQIAIDAALAPLRNGEGPRIGVLGDSGCGKTEFLRQLVATYGRVEPNGITYIVDDKEPEPQFPGQLRRDRNDLQARPADPKGPKVIVFRGDQFSIRHGQVDPETIAELQWGTVQAKRPCAVVYDELDKACISAFWKRGDDSVIRWAFIKGRNLRAASFWGTQETQAVPREAFNQSSSMISFRMVGAPLRLLKERGYLHGGVEKIIPTLPGDELPRNQRGYFVLLRRGRPWDGKVYRLLRR